jgi:cyclic pyranopterin phosphate synthase
MDQNGKRVINYLRISVTDFCNYRCTYCMPPGGIQWLPRTDILTFEEICSIVNAAIPLGVDRIRLTGGEPLMRHGIVDLVKMLAHLPGIDDIALTTNGSRLEDFAATLRESGVKRINVSLDSLRPERYREITRGGSFNKVWRGIEAARSAGFDIIKLNVVVIKGINDDEIEDFAALTRKYPFEVRFIEYMPVGPTELSDRFTHVSAEEMRKRISAHGQLHKLSDDSHGGPAERYKLQGARAALGFISAMSHRFCSSCNRLRLTADGRLLSCLFSGQSIEVKSLLRSGAPSEKIAEAVRLAIESKPMVRPERCSNFMSSIGG